MKKRLALALPVLLAAVAAPLLAGGGRASPDDPVISLAQREVDVFRQADLIVVGRLVEVHRSPGIWCGIVATRQKATFEVSAVLAGDASPEEVTTAFLLVSGGPFVDEEPRLDPERFRFGSRWLLCLKRDGERWLLRDETFAARLLESPPAADGERAAVLQAALGAVEAWLHPEAEERLPLLVVANDAVTPAPVLHAGGRPVVILPRDRIGDRPFLEFTRVEIDGPDAEIGLRYPVEGVTGHVDLRRSDGEWHLSRHRLAER